MSASTQESEDAQRVELESWTKHSCDVTRILHELAEHSGVSRPLRRLTGEKRFARALEVGVGCFGLGFLAAHFSDRIDRMDGLDPLPRLELQPNDAALRRYLQEIRARMAYVVGQGERLPFDSAVYDLVVSINVVDHAQTPEKILEEMNRVLKPGGLLVFGVNTLSALGELKWRIGRWFEPGRFLYVAHPHTFQWRRADAMVRRTVRGKMLWCNKPHSVTVVAGHGRMSFWILKKDD